jgi:hypothetical protein
MRVIRWVAYNDSAKMESRLHACDDVTIAYVKSKSPSFRRRELSAVVRKARLHRPADGECALPVRQASLAQERN